MKIGIDIHGTIDYDTETKMSNYKWFRYWHWRLFCIFCGYNIRAAGNNGDMFHAMCGVGDCCPVCGAAVEKTRLVPEDGKPFVNKLVRGVSTSVWYKPRTWNRGYWEERKRD